MVGVVTAVDAVDVGVVDGVVVVVVVVVVEVEVVVVVEVVFCNHSVKILITLCEVSLKYRFQQSSGFDKFQIILFLAKFYLSACQSMYVCWSSIKWGKRHLGCIGN